MPSARPPSNDPEVFVELLNRPNSRMPSMVSSLGQSSKQQVKDVVRLLLVVCPALLTVIVLCVFGMIKVGEKSSETHRLQSHVIQAQSTRKVLEHLRKERGITCAYITTKSTLFHGELIKMRKETDLALANWTEEAETLKAEVGKGRDMVDNDLFKTCKESIDFYTSITKSLMTSVYDKFFHADDGAFWNLAVHFNNMLYANDLIGLKRAMGSSFLGAQPLGEQNMTEYHEITGSSSWLLNQAKQHVPSANRIYKKQLERENKLLLRISALEDDMTKNTFNATLSSKWFRLMTRYMFVIGKMEEEISDQLETQLQIKLQQTNMLFWMQIFILITISLICPCLILAYALHMNRLVTKCRMYSAEVRARGTQIQEQHHRTELFLNRILPVLQRLVVNCNCQNSNREFVSELQQDIVSQVWELRQENK